MRQFELMAGEKILARRRARMYKDGKWSGWRGHLAVTDRRVWFEAHVLGLFGTEQEIAFDDIEVVELRNTLGFMPNNLFIRTRNGRSFDFVTGGRRRLKEIIASHMRPS